MKLHLHKHILKMIAGFFVISPLFVYAEGFRISLYPSKAEQVISCVSFFAHKISVSDLTDEEYGRLITLAHHDLKIQTLSFNPSKNGEFQDEARFKRDKELLEIVQLGISHHVYKEVLNFVKTSEENKENSSSSTTQTNRNIKVIDNKTELEALKQQAREVLLRYPVIIVDPNNLNLRDRDGKTYLHLAAEENIIELIEALLLLNPNLLDIRDENGETSLLKAVRNARNETVVILLEKGADPNLQSYIGRTALILAAAAGHSDVIKILLKKGADPNLQNSGGWTALMLAAAEGHNNAVRSLLEKGADPNLQNIWGSTALMWAVKQGHNNLIRTLIENGADPTIKNNKNMTALNIAVKEGNFLTAAMLAYYQYKYYQENKRMKNMNRTN